MIGYEINEADIQVLNTIFHFKLCLLILQVLLNIGIPLEESVIYINHNIQIFGLRSSDLTFICGVMNLKINETVYRTIMAAQCIQTILYFGNALKFHFVLQALFVIKEYLHFADNGVVWTAVNR